MVREDSGEAVGAACCLKAGFQVKSKCKGKGIGGPCIPAPALWVTKDFLTSKLRAGEPAGGNQVMGRVLG